MTDSDAAGLEARLKIVEDKLAIYELIASHPLRRLSVPYGRKQGNADTRPT